MARPFHFEKSVRDEARFRQWRLCALCGDSMDDDEEHAHHVVPNQSGNALDLSHVWLASAENCVVLHQPCHDRAHENGRFRLGGVAPPDYFPHSHGNNIPAHKSWAKEFRTKIESHMALTLGIT